MHMMGGMRLFDRIHKIYAWTPAGKRLLDVGCDRGFVTQGFAQKAKEVYGIDNNKEAIAYGKKHHTGVTLIHAPGERIPFKNEYFDIVVMGDVLEHVEDEKKTLNEVYRVMKKDGTLLISVPHKGLFRWIDTFNMKFYFPRLYRWWKGKKYDLSVYTIQPWHRHYSLHDLKKLFGNKFEVVKVHRGGLLVYPLCWLCGDITKDLFGNKIPVVGKILTWLGHIDYTIPFGPFGYSILVRAKRR